MLYIKNKVYLCIGDFIIFKEERQVEVYGKGLASTRNMTRFVMEMVKTHLVGWVKWIMYNAHDDMELCHLFIDGWCPRLQMCLKPNFVQILLRQRD